MSTETSFKGSSNSRTSEVLVTFSAKWREPLLSGSINCVLRRRYPKFIVPTRMYLYIAAPFSQVIGVSKITRIIDVNLTKAKTLKNETQLQENELIRYFDGYEEIGCYHIGDTEFYHTAINLEELRNNWSFYPPQSFVSLSWEAVQWFAAKGTVNSRSTLTPGDASISAERK